MILTLNSERAMKCEYRIGTQPDGLPILCQRQLRGSYRPGKWYCREHLLLDLQQYLEGR